MEIFIVLIICVLQIIFFGVNCGKLQCFKNIFPDVKGLSINIIDGFVQDIKLTQNRNNIFKVILSSINKYLSNNKGKISDYHLIKDIVDRNVDAKEDEINTLIPIPIYLGLVGTMGSILVGLFKLDLSSVISGSEKTMVDGIRPLLSGVAVAMITSVLGIICTTIGSYIAKDSKAKVEENKNTFLSWIQENLLPQLSNDTAGALIKMTQDLSDFNRTFAQNNAQFTATLSKIVDTSDKQAELIKIISQLQDKNITAKNLALLNILEKWVLNLHNVKDYNDFLMGQIKDISGYFKAEREQIEQRKTLLAEAINKVDANASEALKEFNTNFIVSLQKVQETFERKIFEIGDTLKTQQETVKVALHTQNETIFKSIEDQQKTFDDKLQSPIKFVESLNIIGYKITSMMKTQNDKMDELLELMRTPVKNQDRENTAPAVSTKVYLKNVVIIILSFLTVVCFIVLILVYFKIL